MPPPLDPGAPRAAPTSFVGRAEELERVEALSRAAPLLTIVGPPGVGKTRLVLEHALRNRGALFCDLAGARSREDAERAVAAALRLGPHTAAQLGAAIADRGPVTIALDGFDGFDAAAATVGAWRSQAPAARFIVTSRRRLGLTGEVMYDLPPLAAPRRGEDEEGADALRLFVERARAVRAGWEPSAEERALCAEIVAQLDGVPLAVELAAAKIRALGPREILDDLRALGGARSPLGAALESSWRALDPAEQAALAQLSVFAGSFSIEAAAAVVDAGRDAAELLAALRDRSLVELDADRPSGVRYRLRTSVRAFAEDRLAESGSLAAACARHARHVTGAALGWRARFARLGAGEDRAALELATADLLAIVRRAEAGSLPPEDRAEAAISAALALDPLLAVRGPWSLRLSLLDTATRLAADPGVPRRRYAEVLLARADARRLAGAAPLGLTDAREARAIAEALGDAALVGRARAAAATLHVVLSEVGAARDEAALALAGAADPWVEARAVYILGVLDLGTSDLASARARCAEAARAAHRLDDALLEAQAQGAVARVEQENRRFSAARRHYEGALSLALALGDRRIEGNCLANIAASYHDEGDLEAACAAYERVLALEREIGNRREEALVTACLGAALAALGRVEPAEARFAAAAGLLRGAVEPAYQAAMEVWRGFLDLARAARAPEPEARELRREASLRLERVTEAAPGAPALAQRSPAVRAAARMLRAALEADARRARASLDVAPDGSWFARDGEPVRLHRRAVLGALLRALVEARRAAPGEALSIPRLFASGWPGQRASAETSANRVHNALSTLRTMGLRDVLIRREDGYLLDPEVELRARAAAVG